MATSAGNRPHAASANGRRALSGLSRESRRSQSQDLGVT